MVDSSEKLHVRLPHQIGEPPVCRLLRGYLVGPRPPRPDEDSGAGAAAAVAAAVERWSEKAPEFLTGPASWLASEPRSGRLLLARDRLGVEALFFRFENGVLALAQNAASLLGGGPAAAEISPEAAARHLAGLPLARGQTFFRGVRAVPPGDLIAFGPTGQTSTTYWSIQSRPLNRRPDKEILEQTLAVLAEAVPQHYPEGVPDEAVAVTLSGGLDSTTVAALVSAHHRPWAFRWTARSLPEADEDSLSLQVARQLGMPSIELAADEYWPLGDGALRTYADTPFANQYHAAWEEMFRILVEHGAKALLTGFGGDHLWGGGVPAYGDLLRNRRVGRLLGDARRHISRTGWGAAVSVLRQLAVVCSPAPLRAWRDRNRPQNLPEWLGTGLADRLPPAEATDLALDPGHSFRLSLMRDARVGEIAPLLGRQARSWGIDLRHPLLDHRLFEFAASLPSWLVCRAGVRKTIVRECMAGRLPNEVLTKPRRTVLTALSRRGLRERAVSSVWSLMENMRAADLGWVNPTRLRVSYRRYLAGEEQGSEFWNAISLEAWLRQHFP